MCWGCGTIPESFARSPQEYIRRCSQELHISRPTVRKVLHTGWRLQAFKTQPVQDVWLRYAFAKDTMERMYEDKWFLERLAFTEGAPVHVRRNVTAWDCEQPQVLPRPDLRLLDAEHSSFRVTSLPATCCALGMNFSWKCCRFLVGTTTFKYHKHLHINYSMFRLTDVIVR
jgi:hypothetical protein